MSNRMRRTFQPKFFLFLLVAIVLLVGIVLLISTLTEQIRAQKQRDSLMLPLPSSSIAPQDRVKQEQPEQKKGPQPLKPGSYPVTGRNRSGLSAQVRLNNEEKLYDNNPREWSLSIAGDEYTLSRGILTFAGNNYRNSFSYGEPTVTLKTLSVKWSKVIGKLDSVAGTGWTGQPLLIEWDKEVLPCLGIREEFKQQEGFTEVIYPAADGNIYFYELQSGNPSRDPINVGVSLLGTGSLDPLGRPMLYVGQGVMSKNQKGTKVAYLYCVDLIQNKVVMSIGGRDYFARREGWNAFDSSPLIINDTLIAPAENGVLYFIPLNTQFDPEAGKISIRPVDRIKYRYSGDDYSPTDKKDKPWYGFESSCAVFDRYLFITDNGGYLQCIDLNTLELLYATPLGGDCDSSPVIEEDGNKGTIFVYCCTQTDKQGFDLPEGWGYSHVLKINGLTGEIVWKLPRIGYIGDGSYKSGCRSTPHAGRGPIGQLLICSFSGAGVPVTKEDGTVDYSYGGRLVAFDKEDGSVVWSVETPGSGDYVSSPVVLYTQRGAAYLLACDRSGQVKLYDATTGAGPLCDPLSLGARIDSTPAAFGNVLVVGTTGKGENGQEATPQIYALEIQ